MSEGKPSPPCDCPLAGYCERHQKLKSPHQFKLCRTREDYRAFWDATAANVPFVPTLMQLALGAGKAFARWVKAGRPRRSPEAVAEIFEICRGCKWFRPSKKNEGKGNCGRCGCQIGKIGGMMNKAAWATESCPIGLWGDSTAEPVELVSHLPADESHTTERRPLAPTDNPG